MPTETTSQPRAPGSTGLLVRTLAMCLLLSAALILPFAVEPVNAALGKVFFGGALLLSIPALMGITRGWRRFLAARRLEAIRRIAAAEPSNPEAQVDLGVFATMYGDPREARAAFERARAVVPKHAGATVGLGHLLVEEGDLDGALVFFQEAAEAHPGDFAANYAVGGVWQRKEQYARAIQAYERALAAEADDGYALLETARCWARLGEAEKAAEYRGKAAEAGATDRELDAEIDSLR